MERRQNIGDQDPRLPKEKEPNEGVKPPRVGGHRKTLSRVLFIDRLNVQSFLEIRQDRIDYQIDPYLKTQRLVKGDLKPSVKRKKKVTVTTFKVTTTLKSRKYILDNPKTSYTNYTQK